MHRDSAAHGTHDELLIARLYGDDVDERERAHALAQMTACEECEVFFADLGAISRATAALTTPPRPRDFTLSPADAARIGRPRRSWSTLSGWGRARALGGSFVAAGFAGLALVGAITMFGSGAGSTPTVLTAAGNRAPEAAAASPSAMASAGPASLAPGEYSLASDGGTLVTGYGSNGVTVGPSASTAAAATSAPDGTMADLAVVSLGPVGPSDDGSSKAGGNDDSNGRSSAGASGVAAGAEPPQDGSTAQSDSSGGAVSEDGIDLRLFGLAGFAAVTVAGLALLLAAQRLSSGRVDR